jgi:hypothetical protein
MMEIEFIAEQLYAEWKAWRDDAIARGVKRLGGRGKPLPTPSWEEAAEPCRTAFRAMARRAVEIIRG